MENVGLWARILFVSILFACCETSKLDAMQLIRVSPTNEIESRIHAFPGGIKSGIHTPKNSSLIDQILSGTGTVDTLSGSYPICTNVELQQCLKEEKSSLEKHPITELLLEKIEMCKKRAFSRNVHNIHFVLRKSPELKIDIRPTAHTR